MNVQSVKIGRGEEEKRKEFQVTREEENWEKLRESNVSDDHCCCCCCWVASVVSGSVWPYGWQPTRLPRSWDSPGKNTGVGCHFLLQCMKVKSECEVAQLCPTLSNPMDCSPPGSSIHGIYQARVLEWGAIAFSLMISVVSLFCPWLK